MEVARHPDCDGIAAALVQVQVDDVCHHQKVKPSMALETRPAAAAALAVLTDPVLWRTITPLMTGWSFPVYQLWRERVPKDHQKFPLKHGAIPHIAITEDNFRVLELAYELCKIPCTRAKLLLDMAHVMVCAAHHGRLEMLQWMVKMVKKEPEWWVCEENLVFHPVRRRDFDMMSFLHENLPRDNTRIEHSTLKQAWVYDHDYALSEQGNSRMKYLMDHARSLEMLQVMHGHRTLGCSERVMEKTVKHREFQMAKFLFADRQAQQWPGRAMDEIARSGNLELVQFVHEHRVEGFSNEAMAGAAVSGHLQVVQFLHENRDDGCASWAMDRAAAGGHLEVVKFLHKYRSEGCTQNAMNYAAAYGYLDVVKFLHENRSEGCAKVAMDDAAANGHLKVVRFLHENRTERCTKNAMDNAAVNGHLEVVKFLHENRSEGCTIKALHSAVMNDDFPMVQFLGENRTEGCKPQAIDMAASKGHLEVVKVLHENRRGKEGDCTKAAMDAAAAKGYLDVVKFLHESHPEGCTKKAMDNATAHGHLDVVTFLHEKRTDDCTFKALNSAAGGGHLEVVKFLVANRSEGCASEALDAAADSDHEAVVQFLREYVAAE